MVVDVSLGESAFSLCHITLWTSPLLFLEPCPPLLSASPTGIQHLLLAPHADGSFSLSGWSRQDQHISQRAGAE